LNLLKSILGVDPLNEAENDKLNFYLDNAKAIICEMRNSDEVEPKYLTHQIKIAVELYNRQGAEGQISHSENGISRMYEKADISPSLLAQITPMVRTPFSNVRVVV
jgi:hypothetical protein